jgi:hypothetical protein
MDKKKKRNPNEVRIVITWDGVEGEGQSFKIKFNPDPLNPDTNLRNHLVVLANAFAAGTRQIMSLIKPLPQPTEEELKTYTYNFEEHGEEYGEGLFALYNYKKAVMEEFVTIVERVLPDAFHDVLFVKGAQEKIFEKLREDYRARKEFEEDEARDGVIEVKEKGVVS